MIIKLTDLAPIERYHIMTQSIVPRPIAWVLSKNIAGDYNLAPFSYFTAVASNPPLLMFSVAPKSDGTMKDTVINITREKEFVIHIADSNQLRAVQDSAEPIAYGESELNLTGQQLTDFQDTALPRLNDCSIAFACKLYQKQQISNIEQTLIFGEITHVYVADEITDTDGKRIRIDAKKLSPLCRLGLGQFADIANIRQATK